MCKLDKLLLYSYEDNSIEPLEKIIVEEHLKYCSECRNELREIREFEENINLIDFEDINFPKELDDLCALVIDNCISQEDYNSSYKDEIKLLKSNIKDSYKLRYNNPYNKAIRKNINSSTEFIKKTAKKYCKNKFEKSKLSKNPLYKILKAV